MIDFRRKEQAMMPVKLRSLLVAFSTEKVRVPCAKNIYATKCIILSSHERVEAINHSGFKDFLITLPLQSMPLVPNYY